MKTKTYKENDPRGICKKCGHNHITEVGDTGENNDEIGYDLLPECIYCDCEEFKK